MDFIELKFNTPDGKTLYRFLPAQVMHPRSAPSLTQPEFDALSKQKMVSTPSIGKGHAGSDLWYSGSAPDHFYVLQIRFEKSLFSRKPDQFYRSICTYTPQFGVDTFDGWLCADIEELVLLKVLNRPTQRLLLFGDNESVPLMDYLKSRGFPPAIS